MKIKVAPSILSADFSCLAQDLKRAESAGADMLHIDVMDGHFVPNITIGPVVVKYIRKITRLPLDVHLMIERPQDFIAAAQLSDTMDQITSLVEAAASGDAAFMDTVEKFHPRVLSPLEIFSNGQDISQAVTRPLSELKVVCYYGCLLTRPSKVMQFDECEYPMVMDGILRSVGIATLDWSYKTECCGGSMSIVEVSTHGVNFTNL